MRSTYHNSHQKKLFDLGLSFLGLVISLPLIIIISMLIKLTSKGPVLFVQKRAGKDGKIFRMFKFRTMNLGASRLQRRYMSLNDADGPVFKIYKDPRFTNIGKLLSRIGLDELPQFINVLKGEMSVVGPRPLPVEEARRLSKNQKVRELVKPGITSNWVVSGSHKLSFDEWMKLDRKYVKTASFTDDLSIVWRTLVLVVGFVLKYIFF